MSTEDVQLVALFLLLVLSGFFSSAETALTTVNKIRMRTLADEKAKGADTVLKLIEDPAKMLSTILIGNNIVNLSASSITTSLAIKYFNNVGAGIATGILTVLILIFGEITPKTLASLKAERLSMKYAKYILILSKVLTPVIIVINFLAGLVMRFFGINTKKTGVLITENELLTYVDVSHEEGVIESEEREMITNIVDFGDSLAKDVMVPQIDICFVDVNSSYEELLPHLKVDKYTRLPVYQDTKDNVIGVLNIKDILFYDGSKEDFNIKKVMRKPFFTYEYKNTSELFIEMKKKSIPMAIVLDEYGSTAGLLTLEDLIEEIVGEIRDEFDYDEVDLIQPIAENEFMVDGSAKLDDINERLGLELESNDYDSIAGHIINLMEHIPFEGETIKSQDVVYTVKKLDKNRIEKILIKLSDAV